MLANMNYDMNLISQYLKSQEIIKACKERFKVGVEYRAKEVKSILQGIYDTLGLTRTATATQLREYIQVMTRNRTQPDGSRQEVYVIM